MAIWHRKATHEECFPMSRMSRDQKRRRKLQERNKRRRKEGSNPDDGPFFTAQRPYIPMQKLLRVGEREELTPLPDGTEKKTHTVHWRNDEYAVAVYLPGCDNELTQVTVQRLDGAPARDWRHLQQIKNETCGPEREAFEVFPPQSRVFDHTNTTHLWVFPVGVVNLSV